MQERDNTVEKLRQYGFTHEEIQFKLEKQGLASKVFSQHVPLALLIFLDCKRSFALIKKSLQNVSKN